MSFYAMLQYYLEQNLEARQRELDREEELEIKGPTVKAKSKMSKVCISSAPICDYFCLAMAPYEDAGIY